MRIGRVVHISEITRRDNGLKCGCHCPHCQSRLEARMGDHNAHHFSHYDGGKSCVSSLESALHRFAKEVLSEEKAANAPFGMVSSD